MASPVVSRYTESPAEPDGLSHGSNTPSNFQFPTPPVPELPLNRDRHQIRFSEVENGAEQRPSTKTAKSETQLKSFNVQGPLHYHHDHHGRPETHRHHYRSNTYNPRSSTTAHSQPRDNNDWLSRAGLALSSSTREEKGQSWLEKRDSSTSLVSDSNMEIERELRQRRHQKSRSGYSTPVHRPEWGRVSSHPASRHSSRIDLRLGPSYSPSDPDNYDVYKIDTPWRRDTTMGYTADFVDPSIRELICSLQDPDNDIDDNGDQITTSNRAAFTTAETDDGIEFGMAHGSKTPQSKPNTPGRSFEAQFYSDASDVESIYEVDEAEVQRLTLDQGFGLGSWVDRLVGWVFFGEVEGDDDLVDALVSPSIVSTPLHGEERDDALDREMLARRGILAPANTRVDALPGSDRDEAGVGSSNDGRTAISSPVEEGGVVDDVKWLFGVAWKAAF